MVRKLQSNRGETLAETLVAALIGVIALLLLASMIMASTKLVNKSGSSIEELYNRMEQMEQTSSETGKKEVNITWKIAGGATKTFTEDVKRNTSDSFESYELE